jgi:hypothetical protein
VPHALGLRFEVWREEHRKWFDQSGSESIQAYSTDPMVKEALKHALENVQFPDIFNWCDDIASGLIEDFAKLDPVVALPRAKADPERYLATWTYALLVRVSQFAQTIPVDERAHGPFGRTPS